MGTFWTGIIAALLAAYPGAQLTTYQEGQPWPFVCMHFIEGGGLTSFGAAEMPDRWDPEPIEDTCDRAALDLMLVHCEFFEDQENPPEYCQF